MISETRDTRPGVTPRLFEIREGTRTNRSAHQGKVSSWAPKLRRSAPGRRPWRLFEAGVAIKRGVEDSSYGGHEDREQEEINKHHGQAEEQAGSAPRHARRRNPLTGYECRMIQPADPGGRSDCGLASGKWDVERKQREEKCQGQSRGKALRPPGCGSTSRLGENGETRGFFRRFRPDRDRGDWQDERRV